MQNETVNRRLSSQFGGRHSLPPATPHHHQSRTGGLLGVQLQARSRWRKAQIMILFIVTMRRLVRLRESNKFLTSGGGFSSTPSQSPSPSPRVATATATSSTVWKSVGSPIQNAPPLRQQMQLQPSVQHEKWVPRTVSSGYTAATTITTTTTSTTASERTSSLTTSSQSSSAATSRSLFR